MKRSFLVVYDYGQGGVWAFLLARSEAEIEERFPELNVVDHPPKWMSKSHLARLRRGMTFDIDSPRGFLKSVLAQRPVNREGPSASHA
jgi:hypothetical protein